MHDDVDLTDLSANERATYAELAAQAARGVYGRPLAALGIWLVLTVGLLTAYFLTLHSSSLLANDVVGLLALVVGLGGGMRILLDFRDAGRVREDRQAQARRYLQRIRYHERVRTRPPAPRDPSSGGPPTPRQAQRDWYGEPTGLPWRVREMGQRLGVDADTYVSNYLEHDKD